MDQYNFLVVSCQNLFIVSFFLLKLWISWHRDCIFFCICSITSKCCLLHVWDHISVYNNLKSINNEPGFFLPSGSLPFFFFFFKVSFSSFSSIMHVSFIRTTILNIGATVDERDYNAQLFLIHSCWLFLVKIISVFSKTPWTIQVTPHHWPFLLWKKKQNLQCCGSVGKRAGPRL